MTQQIFDQETCLTYDIIGEDEKFYYTVPVLYKNKNDVVKKFLKRKLAQDKTNFINIDTSG